MIKDGKFLCFACGRRLDGMFSKHHAPGCPFGCPFLNKAKVTK